MTEGERELLIPENQYLTSGVHIGTQQKSANMMDFIFKVRHDGLYVLDIKKTDERIEKAASVLSKYKPEEILIVSARQYGQKPIRKMGEHAGVNVIPGRFIPGRLTNPRLRSYLEPKIIMVTDPAADGQAMREALNINVPVIALCDANNETKNVDLVIPTNNKGRKALAIIYWLLTREYLARTGRIESSEAFEVPVEDFESTL